MTLAVKRKGAASEVERDQPAPTVKRRCTRKTCNRNGDAPKPSSSTSIPSSFVGCNVAESIEEEESQTSAITSTVKPEDGTVIHQEDESRSRVTGTKVEQPASQQRIKREGSDAQDLVEYPVEQHSRRSAAPSPFASAHGAAQGRFIGPEELPSVVHGVLKYSPCNPGCCLAAGTTSTPSAGTSSRTNPTSAASDRGGPVLPCFAAPRCSGTSSATTLSTSPAWTASITRSDVLRGL
ncbi:hypothetical protein MY4038_000889 [Beauveria bassiana]